MTNPVLIDQTTPRRFTLGVLARLWVEPRVRAWWMGAIFLTLVGAGFVVVGLRQHYHTRWLMERGTPVDAVVMMANDEWIKNRPEPPDSLAYLEFTWHGQLYKARPRYLEGRREFIITGSVLPIHVNPDNPEDWTWLTEPLPILTRLIGVLVTAPLVVLCLLMALLRFALSTRTWRHAEMVDALVVDTHFSAFAPLCPAVRTTPADIADRRVYTVYLPGGHAPVMPGDELLILRPRFSFLPVIAVDWWA